ncbi:hypothetical protein V1T76_00635 [Roseibium sp. FZY0029]|uniref:capsular polysaccharide export protein, LipB/KpsS family n=1 Tax=Roseibium sp. FZY0029 TaxID=3116647 RepID=UPI002EAE62EE|nr:hypothetical protein [Roseibium sp. FZY0029]
MNKFKLSSFIEKKSPNWLKKQPWAVDLYHFLFSLREVEPKRAPIRNTHPNITPFTRPGGSDEVAILVISHKNLRIKTQNDNLKPILLKIDKLSDESILSILKTRLISSVLKCEKDYKLGILSTILLDDTLPHKEVIAQAVAEIGFNSRNISEYTVQYEPEDIDNSLEMKLRNVIFHCGLHYNRKPTFLFADNLDDNNIIWDVARYAENTGNPIVIVDERDALEKNYDKYLSFSNVGVLPGKIFSDDEVSNILQSGFAGFFSEVDKNALLNDILYLGTNRLLLPSASVEALRDISTPIFLSNLLRYRDQSFVQYKQFMNVGVNSVSLANKLDNLEVINGVQKYILEATKSKERTFGGNSYSLSDESARSEVFLRWGTSMSRTRKKFDTNSKKLGRPYVQIEDGFIRSIEIGAKGSPGLSFLCDDLGAYYDARSDNRFQQTLNSDWSPSADLAQIASDFIISYRRERLSKYNHAPDLELDQYKDGRKKILLIDQRFGDASIKSGLADEHSFNRMLQTAILEHTDHEIILKRHPDATVGGMNSYFSNTRIASFKSLNRVHLIDTEVNPHSLFDVVDKVFVVTSGMGFEALIAEKPVRCFGAPYYSNWGLTHDEVTISSRTRSRSIIDIVCALWIESSLYVDPKFGNSIPAKQFIDRFSKTVEMYRKR